MKTNLILSNEQLSVLILTLEQAPARTEQQTELLEMLYGAFADCRPDVSHDFTL